MKKPLFLLLTDPHISEKNYNEVYDVLLQAITACKEHEINTIVIGGDIFTSRKGQLPEPLMIFRKWLQECKKEKIKVISIAGNHDKVNLDEDISFLDGFNDEQNFKLVNRGFIDLTNTFRLHLLSYYREHGNYPQYLQTQVKQVKNKSVNFLVTHISVTGVRNNDGSEVANNITPELFEAFDVVTVGHYHNASQVGKNIHYIGSTHPQNYGEDNEKGFKVVYEDGEMKHHYPVFKEFHKITLDVKNITPEILEQLETDAKENNIKLRVDVVGGEVELKAFDKDKLKALGVDVQTKSKEVVEGIIEAEENDFVAYDASMLMEEFQEFSEAQNISEENKNICLNYLKNLKTA